MRFCPFFTKNGQFLPILGKIIKIHNSLLFIASIGLLYVNWGTDSKIGTFIDPTQEILLIFDHFRPMVDTDLRTLLRSIDRLLISSGILQGKRENSLYI